MKVFAPTAFRWPAITGKDYPYGLQDIADDSLCRTLLDANLVVADDPSDQTDNNKNPLGGFSNSQRTTLQGLVSAAGKSTPAYLAMIPGNQPVASGSAKSLVKSSSVLIEAYPSSLTGRGTLTDAQMWATAGYMATTAGAGGQIEIPLGSVPLRFDQAAHMIAIGIKAAAPGATSVFLGQGNSGTGAHGLSLRADTAGKVQVLYITAAGTFQIGTSAGVYFDGTDHTLMLVIHPCGYVCLFRDGEIDTTWTPNNAYPIGAITESQPLTIGGAPAASGTAIAGLWRGLHVMRFSATPLNLGFIAKRLAGAIQSAVDTPTVSPTKTIGLFWGAGQSNEAGAGDTPGYTGALGIPHKDGSGGRSIIPGLAAALANRSVAALWATTAFGSTSIADTWCGRIRNWVSGLNIVHGSYVLYSGVVYKCNNGLGYTANSTTAPAVGTGADGVTWVSMGAPTADDTATLAGTGVYSSSSARWDPTGLIAIAVAKAAMIRPWVDQMLCLICLGQQDRYVGSTAAVYSDAIQKLANYYLSLNSTDRVLICMTVRSSSTADYSAANGGGAPNAANTSADNWYNTHLIPGRAAALAALAGNSRVSAGWDWASTIGTVTNQSYPTGIGVRAVDSVHMTDATYETRAVPAVDATLQTLGY